MFDKIIFTLILSMILLAAAMIAMPVPILWALGCVTFIGLSMTFRSPYRG